MMNKDIFYKELSSVPPLPENVYTKVQQRINKKNYLKNSLLSLAALLILVIGLFNFVNIKQSSEPLSNEVASELQTIYDYLNGEDLEQELNSSIVISSIQY